MKMEAAIIEDLAVAADYLTRCCEKSGIITVRASFENVPDAIEFLNEHRVGLLFLDVEMSGATGFELLDSLNYQPLVILTTSKEEYAYNAFQYHVSDFLKKPFTYKRFMEALEKVVLPAEREVFPQTSDHFFIKTEGKLVRLTYDDVLYIESVGNYARFVTPTHQYLIPSTIKALEEKVDKERFMRVHRSFIVNLQKITDIRENDLYISGTEIPISKSLRSEVLKRIVIL